MLLAPLAALKAGEAPKPVKPNDDGPVVRVTILRAGRDKSCGLDAQLTALRPAKGKLLVGTNVVAASTADFAFCFSWRSSKDAPSSNVAPSIMAADVESARKSLLVAMGGSFSAETLASVKVQQPTNGADNYWEVVFPKPSTGASLARQNRVARRLVAARLVELHMLSATAGTWPAEFRPDKLLALYDADGTAYSNSTLLDRAVDETTLDAHTVAVCPEDIREGILDRCIGVLFPGGTGRGIAAALHPDGVQRVREFVAKGGGYFGVCAGAYFASSGRPDYAGMIPLRHDKAWEKGHTKLKLGLTPEGVALLGPEFLHIETFYNCGPVFPDLAPEGQRAPVFVLATFESPSTDAKGLVRNEMVGTPAILSMQWQKGRIMIISPHPESQPKFYPLVARAIGWTIGQDPKSVQARTRSTQ
jgi:putative intracellular protease/amidase